MSFINGSRLNVIIRSKNILNSHCCIHIACHPKAVSSDPLQVGLPFHQIVRWKKTPCRKPIWLPVAPTKLFRISKHPEVPEDERNEHERLFTEYKIKMNSITQYFRDEYNASAAQGEVALELEKKAQQEFQELLRMNDLENKRVAELREEQYRIRLRQKEEETLQKAMDMEEWMKNKQKEIEELVKLEKEKSKTYITTKKLDAAIEEAIDNPVNYHFAIDLEGKIHWETYAHPQEDPKYTFTDSEAARKAV